MAYPFAAAEVLTAVDLNAMIGAPTQNAQTGTTYTAVLLDAGKTVTLSNASAVTLTIPAQASVSWADNTQLNFLNLGAGTVTITPAATVTINGEPLTLETSKGGSLVRTASNTWTFTPTGGGGGGKVLQVVSAAITTSVTVTTATNTSSGITASITPSSTSNKVLVMVQSGIIMTASYNNYLQLYRDTTNLGEFLHKNVTYGLNAIQSITFLDSPSTTSPVAYALYGASSAGGSLTFNYAGKVGTITLIEVAA